MKKIKVLYITPVSRISGAETGLLYLLDSALNEMVEVVVVCPGEGPLVEELEKRKVKVITLKLHNFMLKNPYLYLSTIKKLYKVIKKEKPTIIHSNGVSVNQYAAVAARLARVPCVVYCHTVEFFSKANSMHLGLCNQILTNSKFTAKEIRKFLAKSNIEVVYPGVDLKKFSPRSKSALRKRWKIPAKTKVVGMIGMFLPRKGQDSLVEAAKIVNKKFPDTLFVFAGSSVFTSKDYENKVKKLAKEYSINSLFTGFINVTEIIPALDVFCMPSVEEAFGNVLNEVGAMKIPIVAFNSGGIPEIINDNYNGLLVKPKSTEEFALKIIKILDNEKLAKKLAENARKIVLEKFDARRYAKDLLKVYRRLG